MGLELNQLSVKLGEKSIIRDISASFRPGRICAILGPNGAGKSTLIKSAAGLVSPIDGQITLNEEPLTNLRPKDRSRKIAYLPQNYSVAWDILVRDVVALGRFSYSGTGASAIEQAMIATDTLQFADRTTGQLSGGELARVMLARVLAGEPEWILADEPLASLDPYYQLDMVQRFHQIAAGGTAIIIVLHDINLAAKLADDVLMIKDGNMLAFGAAKTELTAVNLKQLYDIEISRIADGKYFQIGE